ncbi:MAG: TIGR02453 family protein [Flavobacteriaceae bacterium]|nr:TIGR02453 family protein [Flavobacteriaceae bacterium]|tara:strand:- start:1185 stop:1871 length:687 start_codon:yes stop_codon:yes gene_type:complete
MTPTVPKSSLEFLNKLAQNNHKDWMDEHRNEYKTSEKALKACYAEIEKELNKTDEIAKVKIFRINRDIRFSKDKTPYNIHRSVSFSRAGAHRRGGYYLRIEPGDKSVVAGGFFGPEPADLLRVRKEFEMDASPIRTLLSAPKFKKAFGGTFDAWDPVKTAPKGFSKDDPNIDLIRLKNFIVTHSFTDAEVVAPNFIQSVVEHFELLRPFFDYMSEVLTTDLNGVSTLP